MRRMITVAAWMGLLTGCGGGDPPPASISASGGTPPANPAVAPAEHAEVQPAPAAVTSAAAPLPSGPISVRLVTNHGSVTIQLEVEGAPQTVANFLKYIDGGYYDGTLFHYVSDSMLLAGGFTAEHEPAPAFAPILNESDNGLSNTRGTVAMSRDPQEPHTATSQFFFNLQDNTGYDHEPSSSDQAGLLGDGNGYCVFGRVVEGLEVLEKISQQPVNDAEGFVNLPVEPVMILQAERVDP